MSRYWDGFLVVSDSRIDLTKEGEDDDDDNEDEGDEKVEDADNDENGDDENIVLGHIEINNYNDGCESEIDDNEYK